MKRQIPHSIEMVTEGQGRVRVWRKEQKIHTILSQLTSAAATVVSRSARCLTYANAHFDLLDPLHGFVWRNKGEGPQDLLNLFCFFGVATRRLVHFPVPLPALTHFVAAKKKKTSTAAILHLARPHQTHTAFTCTDNKRTDAQGGVHAQAWKAKNMFSMGAKISKYALLMSGRCYSGVYFS